MTTMSAVNENKQGPDEPTRKATILAVGRGLDHWKTLGPWIEDAGFDLEVLTSAHDVSFRLERIDAGVVLLDAAVPGFHALITSNNTTPASPPVIVLTETVEFDSVVRAFRSGAIDVLPLPVRRQTFVERLVAAAQADYHRARHRQLYRRLTRLMGSLTPRERQVMQCVVEGSANKQIAADLGISEKTVEVHRHKVMRKMEADSLAALVRMNMVIEASSEAVSGAVAV